MACCDPHNADAAAGRYTDIMMVKVILLYSVQFTSEYLDVSCTHYCGGSEEMSSVPWSALGRTPEMTIIWRHVGIVGLPGGPTYALIGPDMSLWRP